MADLTYNFSCPDCGEDLEAEIIVHSGGHGPTGMGGPPEFSSPGEGPEYSLEKDVVCTGQIDDNAAKKSEPEPADSAWRSCGRIFDDDYFQSGKPCDEICEQIAELGASKMYDEADYLEDD